MIKGSILNQKYINYKKPTENHVSSFVAFLLVYVCRIPKCGHIYIVGGSFLLSLSHSPSHELFIALRGL